MPVQFFKHQQYRKKEEYLKFFHWNITPNTKASIFLNIQAVWITFLAKDGLSNYYTILQSPNTKEHEMQTLQTTAHLFSSLKLFFWNFFFLMSFWRCLATHILVYLSIIPTWCRSIINVDCSAAKSLLPIAQNILLP